MFLEPQFKGQRSGWIEVICGSMFSGKTEELIRRLKRAKIANQKVEVFKPTIDNRYDKKRVVSHDSNTVLSVQVNEASEILDLVEGFSVIAIYEAQFFDDRLPQVCEMLALRGLRVLVAGLDMDFRGEPFGSMPQLMAMAEYVTKLHAICKHCGNLATHSYRLTADEQKVMLGEMDSYEARCRTCFHMGNILDFNAKPVLPKKEKPKTKKKQK